MNSLVIAFLLGLFVCNLVENPKFRKQVVEFLKKAKAFCFEPKEKV